MEIAPPVSSPQSFEGDPDRAEVAGAALAGMDDGEGPSADSVHVFLRDRDTVLCREMVCSSGMGVKG
jgi:hypothetical protein